MQWQYDAPGMCISLMKYSTHLQKIVTDRPTKLGTEAPSPELKKIDSEIFKYFSI